MLDDGVVFAAILLFAPGVALLIVGVGVIVSHYIQQQPRAQTIFNSAQLTLQVAVAGVLLGLVGWQPGEIAFRQPDQIGLLALLPLLLYLINTWTVATMIGLQLQCDPWGIWRNAAGVGDVSLRLLQSGLGLSAALLVVHAPWTMPLVVLPGVTLYQLLRTRRRRGQPQDWISVAPTTADERSVSLAHADAT